MSATFFFFTLAVLTAIGFALGRQRAFASVRGKITGLHSLPDYYGMYTALWCAIPALCLVLFWVIFEESVLVSLVLQEVSGADLLPADERSLLITNIRNAAGNVGFAVTDPEVARAAKRYMALEELSRNARAVLALCVAILGLLFARARILPDMPARDRVEKVVVYTLVGCSVVAILTTIGIVFSLVFEASRFFSQISVLEFLFGLEWSPQTAIRADQVGASGAFGAVPLVAGTMMIALIAMAVATPVGLMSAIYLSEYASARTRAIFKPALEVLAGIPTVVYGFFAALTVAPAIRGFGESIGLDVSSESALAAGAVMGVMIIPFVSSLSDDVITAVPRALRDGSMGLGATKSETIRRVVFPAALPGIVAGLLLAVSRAIGETMIVVMAAGLSANLTANPLESVTTVTVQIVTLLVGDQEFDSPKTLAAFALGLMLFCATLALNVVALRVVRKYREAYD